MKIEIMFQCERPIDGDPTETVGMVNLLDCPDCLYHDLCRSDGYLEKITSAVGVAGGAKTLTDGEVSRCEGTGDVETPPIPAAGELGDIRDTLDRFPEKMDLLPNRPAYLPQDGTDRWAELIIDRQWGILLDHLTSGVATPDALFFKNIEGIVKSVFTDRGHRSDIFFRAIARAVWKYIAIRQLPGMLDSLFIDVEQFSQDEIKKANRDKLRAVRSSLRSRVGVESKPQKFFSDWEPRQATKHLRGLVIEIDTLLAERTAAMRSEIIRTLLKRLEIADLSADTIRTTYLRQR